jgi:hypothetical protein
MAVMKCIDGRLYNVPDEQAVRFLIPADKVADTLKTAGIEAPASGQAGQQGSGQVQAYHHGGWGHHGCYRNWGGGWGGGFVVAAPYNNYSNYSNYSNYYGW